MSAPNPYHKEEDCETRGRVILCGDHHIALTCAGEIVSVVKNKTNRFFKLSNICEAHGVDPEAMLKTVNLRNGTDENPYHMAHLTCKGLADLAKEG